LRGCWRRCSGSRPADAPGRRTASDDGPSASTFIRGELDVTAIGMRKIDMDTNDAPETMPTAEPS
jgi:hypothetical protein